VRIIDGDEGKKGDASLSREVCNKFYKNTCCSVTAALGEDHDIVHEQAFWRRR